MITQLIRFVLTMAGALAGLAATNLINWTEQIGFPQYTVIFLFIILGMSIGYVIGGILGREASLVFERTEERLRDLPVTDIALGAVGLVVGTLVALVVSLALTIVSPLWLRFLADVLLYGLLGYSGLRVALIKRSDVRRAFPRFDPGNTAGAPPIGTQPKLLDTSAIIDGRLGDILRSGVLEGPIRVPRFVLAELQTLSDSVDDIKRARGRRGFDILESLQGISAIEAFEVDYPEDMGVDDKLMHLARDTGGTIITVDANLTRVARLREIAVFNIQDLALALRPVLLPGDVTDIMVTREGKEQGQGVGYLEDGTMVVIVGAADQVGRQIRAEVTSVLQTSGGRMVFARIAEGAGS